MKINRKRHQEIKEIAKNCFKNFKTRNPFEIFQKLSIECSLLYLHGDLGGFTNIRTINGKRVFHVYINSKYSLYSQKIIAGHELGHVLLHYKEELNMFEETSIGSIKEYEANIFALELMPQLKPHDKSYALYSIEELQDHICNKLKTFV